MKSLSTPGHARSRPPSIRSTVPRRLIAEVAVPDTTLVSRAIEYARDLSEPYLFNHVMRSWLFAASLAELRGAPYDAEVLAVSTLLHDLGLVEAFSGPLRFEVEGANAARAFAHEEGLDERRTQLIWDSVALNSTPSIGLHKEAEVALCTMGIGVDWGGGWCYDSIEDHRMKSIVEAFPRLKMKERFTRTICGIVESRPETTYDNFARDFGERFVPGYRPPSLVDSLFNSPFEE
ncbi:HD domain-containing protein [Dyella soli]|uniref:HD domain-containing protein n=1 Tax=Dyella soli TaxID=522319 RepID=A0A4R0YKX2_9GAMM|nr:HD domain-containing protein [Dyella soli]